ncbi:MAG: sigma-70 family RNA polymerase sigma factor [Gemmataceae bacterium]|nr:sigma-70 family RNA polymerase sigma factor [Gemmataceae bacterium]
MTEPRPNAARWLPAARAGSHEALGQALEACRRFLLQIAQQELDAELRAKASPSDLVQETFLEAQRDFAQFHGTTEAELLAWLRTLLHHRLGKLRRHYQTTKRRVAREVALNDGSSSADPGGGLPAAMPSPSGQAMAQEQDQLLQQALARLPEDYRRVITWRYQEERSFEEIGRLLHRSPEAARKLWARAIERLQEELEEPP